MFQNHNTIFTVYELKSSATDHSVLIKLSVQLLLQTAFLATNCRFETVFSVKICNRRTFSISAYRSDVVSLDHVFFSVTATLLFSGSAEMVQEKIHEAEEHFKVTFKHVEEIAKRHNVSLTNM